MHVSLYVYMCAQACGVQRSILGTVPQIGIFYAFLRENLSLGPGAHQLNKCCLSSEPQGFVIVPLHEIISIHPCAWLFTWVQVSMLAQQPTEQPISTISCDADNFPMLKRITDVR